MSGREFVAASLGKDANAVERVGLRDDISNADRFAREHEHHLKHVAAFAPSWLTWDGQRWARDETGEHVERAKETADALWQERANDAEKDWRTHASSTRRTAGSPRWSRWPHLIRGSPAAPPTSIGTPGC